MAQAMNLLYVVITSVNRDDLADGGSEHFAEDGSTPSAGAPCPQASIEVLTPDFQGACGRRRAASWTPCRTRSSRRVQSQRRDRRAAVPTSSSEPRRTTANRSAVACASPKQRLAWVLTKSGAMLGLGETAAEVEQLLRDLARAPMSTWSRSGNISNRLAAIFAVAEYIAPAERFEAYRDFGLSLGFKMVFSGPLVRSSYMVT